MVANETWEQNKARAIRGDKSYWQALDVLVTTTGSGPTDYGPAQVPTREEAEEALRIVAEKLGYTVSKK